MFEDGHFITRLDYVDKISKDFPQFEEKKKDEEKKKCDRKVNAFESFSILSQLNECILQSQMYETLCVIPFTTHLFQHFNTSIVLFVYHVLGKF